MAKKRKKITPETKIKVIREVENGKDVTELAKKYGICIKSIYNWQNEYLIYNERAFTGNGNAYKSEAKMAELERKIGQLIIENDLLKKKLLKLKL